MYLHGLSLQGDDAISCTDPPADLVSVEENVEKEKCHHNTNFLHQPA